MAHIVAPQRAAQLPQTAGIDRHVLPVLLQTCNRRPAGQHRAIRLHRGVIYRTAHSLQVGHSAADAVVGHFQAKIVIRLQQHRLGLHQALPYGAVSGLPEVAALRMLQVGAAGCQRQLHIRQRCAHQHTGVGALGQVGQNQPLPVEVQPVGGAIGVQHHSAAARRALHEEMHLRIVAQRFKMTHTLHQAVNGLLIHDAAAAEGYLQPKPAADLLLQHLLLHRAHQVHVDLLPALVPHDAQQRVFLLQLPQLGQHQMGVCPLGQDEAIVQNRLQSRFRFLRFRAEDLPRAGVGQARHRHRHTGLRRIQHLIFCAGVEPQLVGFFLPRGLPFPAAQQLLGAQRAAGDLQPRKPLILFPGNLKDLGTKGIAVSGRRGQPLQSCQKLRRALQLQRRAKPAGVQLALRDQLPQPLLGELTAFQKFLQRRLVAHGRRLIAEVAGRGEIHAAAAQSACQLPHQRVAVCAV